MQTLSFLISYHEKAGFGSSDTGKGKSKISGRHITHGYHLVKGKSNHEMEDYVVAKFKKLHHHDTELGLFAIFDGHLGHGVADYLQSHLFENILHEVSCLYSREPTPLRVGPVFL